VDEGSRRGRKNSANKSGSSSGNAGGGGGGGVVGSDSGGGGGGTGGSMGIAQYQPVLGKKSNSTSQLSATGNSPTQAK
jgi:hypothetical protein